jgi:hypothetical protein
MVADYITEAEFRDYIKDSSNDNQGPITDAISAASRRVEDYCGRHFYQTTETQYFTPDPGNLWVLSLDDMDLANTDSLTVDSQWSNKANYDQSWTFGTDFVAQPVNQSKGGIDGWPFEWLQSLGGKVWPPRYVEFYTDTVRITGNWGWNQVPAPVKQATRIMAAQYYKLAEAPFGTAGWGAYGDITVKELPQVEQLLSPYRKGNALLMA